MLVNRKSTCLPIAASPVRFSGRNKCILKDEEGGWRSKARTMICSTGSVMALVHAQINSTSGLSLCRHEDVCWPLQSQLGTKVVILDADDFIAGIKEEETRPSDHDRLNYTTRCPIIGILFSDFF